MSEEKDHIEELKQSLYSRGAPEIRSRRRFRFTSDKTDVPSDWGNKAGDQPDPLAAQVQPGHHHMSFPVKLLIGSIVFCLIAVGAGSYIFFNGANFISGNNIAIDISGPISVPGGAPVSFGITVTNRNTVALKTADLAIHFPAGTTDPKDTTQSLEVLRESLGDIPSGGSVTKTVEAVIFGEENLQKKITASVTYGIAGSNSVFTKESSYDVIVNASPIVMTVSSLEQAISGQPFDLKLNIKSNSTNTVKNVIMRASYPFGFSYRSANIQPVSGNSVWSIGDIPPGGERNLVIKGVLTGEDSDLKVFHFSVGARSAANPSIIGTTFLETEQVLTIEKPFISISVNIDSDDEKGAYVGSIGRSMNVSLRWANNLPETLSNVAIVAHLSGSAYDKNNVSAWGGYFRSATNDVIWDQRTNPELASVGAGESGTLSFSITPSESQGSYAQTSNPEIDISGSASGDRTGSRNVPLNTGSVVRQVKIVTSPVLSGRVLRGASTILNTGPIPPRAEQKTTYVVLWSLDNTSNIVTNGVVTATLPPHISWASQVSPKSEDIGYDKNSGTVTWHVGNVPAFAGANNARREVQFQVVLEPSVDQVGTAPIVINKAGFTGTDSWTKSLVTSEQGYLTTSYVTDQSYKLGDETVAR